ncbi:hypothetical protein QQS21_005063 [Conoideocrella luteorostrata]|uniref:Calpain catalytic domain-containing protein n=1 Tax=Conoideocrella luteorostrata TaxID=1105319 RepID=A0AAJ0CT58_9HYPO|nr:hypothetical protein QQS21_005063 [Conoideocrella luteorostrata]
MPPPNLRDRRSVSRSRSRSRARARTRTRSRRSGSRSRSRSETSSYRIIGLERLTISGRPKNKTTPQAAVDEFWDKFTSKTPGKATTVIPNSQFVKNLLKNSVTVASASRGSSSAGDKSKPKSPPSAEDLIAYAQPVNASYEAAATLCRAKVEKIIKECRRVNKKYRDAHFDIEADLKHGIRDCLESLPNTKGRGSPPGRSFRPQGVKRATDIFDDPKFYIDGPTANDVRQGNSGDCWLMSALCTLSNKKGIIERLCVAHDQDVGVYGFVFHRDGEWISEIVDDFLYLTKSDYDEAFFDRILFDELERVNGDELYRKVYQSNSGALYFAQCSHQQETWLPLLEKCYAKAHGDFAAIEGGFGGEGIEDMTGGITSEIFTTDILDKELFWKELLSANQQFLFSCGTGVWGSQWGDRGGIIELHSYSVQKAVEVDGKRLVRLKNPWGKGEWKGAWSDGSKEWTPEWLQKIGHRFGDDGDFWIEYKDLLRKYQSFERTRLFEGDWKVAQLWTTLNIPWMVAYHDTYFSFRVATPGRVVIVLTQLDDRYFRGLQGQYIFQLSFRVHRAGQEDYLVRSQLHQRLWRSVSVELELEEGEYEVRVKFDTYRDHDRLPVEDVVRLNAKDNRDKLTSIGLAYDLAHSKGLVVETAEEKAAKEAHVEKLKSKSKQDAKKKLLEDREEEYYMHSKRLQRHKAKELKRRAKRSEKVAAKRAAAKAKKQAKDEAADEKQDDQTKKEEQLPAAAALAERDNAKEDVKDETKDVRDTGDKKVTKDEETALERSSRDTTATVSAGSDGEESGRPTPFCESEEEPDDDDDENLSSIDSMSVYSERELDIRAAAVLSREEEKNGNADKGSESGGEPDEFERDPWNAVAVVGLRVYHQPTDGQETDKNVVTVRVVRPNPYAGDEDAEDAEVQNAETSKTQGLDVDDSAKDATLTGNVADQKKSIVGDKMKSA